MTPFERHGLKPVYLFSEFELRCAAVALARFAVANDSRDLNDPVHEWVTEGRRRRSEERLRKNPSANAYSSCGDLAHWMLYCLGCRDDRVNRNEHKGWRVQVNLSMLVRSPWYVPFGSPVEGPSIGDIVYVANTDVDGHVAVLLSIEDAQQWVTADYGQPYGLRRVCQVRDTIQGRTVRGKRLRGWVDLAGVPLGPPAWVPGECSVGAVYDNPY